MEYCCKEFEEFAKRGDALILGDGGAFIYGKPDFANDGDGYIDNMTEVFGIKHCPFCGKAFAEQNTKDTEG